jgi:excisionase family DNA binding protein
MGKDEKLPRLSSLKDVKWVGHYLGVSRNTVHQWVLEGHIPYINLGVTGGRRIIRFDPLAIEEWLLHRSFTPDQIKSPAIEGREEIDTVATEPDDDHEDDQD